MALMKLDKNAWSDFCDGMSQHLLGKRAEIEVASRDIGVQREVRRLPLIGMAYDRKTDTLEIFLQGVHHMVMHPTELYAEYGSRGLESLAVVDAEYAWQIMLVADPLMLPPADGSGQRGGRRA